MTANAKRVAVVTGANKGIGLEVARQLGRLGLTVVVGARDAGRGEAAAAGLRAQGLDAETVRLDVTDGESVRTAFAAVSDRHGRLDVLVNNSGIFLDATTPVTGIDAATLDRTFRTNVLGAFLATQAAVPLMQKGRYGRIVNVSSTLGSLAEMADPNSPYAGFPGPSYRLSKAALNSLTLLFARELKSHGILVNSCCPGWVRTDMGGPDAPLSVEQGADTAVWLATLPDDGPTGGFFRERRPIAW